MTGENSMTQIALTPVPGSSLIAADGWDASETTLAVQYMNGQVYEFRGLSPQIHAAYEASDSKGKFLKRNIEPTIKGEKV